MQSSTKLNQKNVKSADEEGKENTKPFESKKVDLKKAETKEEVNVPIVKKKTETLAFDKEVMDNKMKSKTTLKESVSRDDSTDKMASNMAGLNNSEVKRLKLDLAEKEAMVEDANREVAQIKEQLNEAKKVVSMTSASKDHAEMERD